MHGPVAGTAIQSSSVSTASAPAGTAVPRPKWVVGHDANGAAHVDDKSEISFEDEHGQKKRHRFRSGLKSLGIGRHRRSSSVSSRASSNGRPTEAEKIKAEAQAAADAPPGVHAATHYDGDEYKNEALDCVLPTTPLKAFKLFFVDKPFLTKFMSEKEGLKGEFPSLRARFRTTDHEVLTGVQRSPSEIEIGPWKALDGSEAQQDALAAAKERDITYLKPLNAPVGPKQTHCFIHDVNEHFGEREYVPVQRRIKVLTRSRCFQTRRVTFRSRLRPRLQCVRRGPRRWTSRADCGPHLQDVPSGNDFTTVTRSVFTWAAGGGCHVRVTTEVEWTKVNRFLRGVIERGAVDGQKSYHADLEELVRERIAASPEEYKIPGVSSDANTEVKSADMATKEPKHKTGRSARHHSHSSRTSSETSLVDSLTDFTSPLFILLVLVVLLLVTNLFTLRGLRQQARLAREARLGHPNEVASAISSVLEKFTSLHSRPDVRSAAHGPATAAPITDVKELQHVVQALEHTLSGTVSEMQVAVERAREVVERAAAIKRLR